MTSKVGEWVEKIKQSPAYVILALILGALFYLSDGFVKIHDAREKLIPHSDLQKIAKSLGSDSPEVRIAGLSQLKGFDSSQSDELQLGLAVVQELLSRRAPLEKSKANGVSAASPREVEMALQAMSHLLQQVDKAHLTLQRPVISQVDLSKLDLGKLYLRDTTWQDVDAQDSLLADTDLEGATMDGAQLARADASSADFTGATLKRVCLEDASLTGAKLDKARIEESDLNGASLRHAGLRFARLQESRMADADLTGAVLTGADLSSVTEWLPDQAAQSGAHEAATFPATYKKMKSGVCD